MAIAQTFLRRWLTNDMNAPFWIDKKLGIRIHRGDVLRRYHVVSDKVSWMSVAKHPRFFRKNDALRATPSDNEFIIRVNNNSILVYASLG